jgi:hypothetical protein
VLGDTLEAIATEKLAVAPPDAIVVLPDETFAYWCPNATCGSAGAWAAEASAGHAIAADPHIAPPALRATRRRVRDGAHNADGARHLVEQPTATTTQWSPPSRGQGRRRDAAHPPWRRSSLVATTSSARALHAEDLASSPLISIMSRSPTTLWLRSLAPDSVNRCS